MVEHKGLLYVGLEGFLSYLFFFLIPLFSPTSSSFFFFVLILKIDFVYAYHMSNGQLKWKVGLTTYGYGPISLAAFAFAPPEGGLHDILFVGTFGMKQERLGGRVFC